MPSSATHAFAILTMFCVSAVSDAVGQCQMQWLRSDPPNDVVNAVARLPNGDLVVGGEFSQAGGRTISGVARWDGRTYWPMGSGLSQTLPWPGVKSLVTLADGTLVAGGTFQQSGSRPMRGLARWDGYAWQPFGSGIPSGGVLAMAALPDGSLLVGGGFQSVDGVPAANLARWDGSNWAQFGAGTSQVWSIEVLPNAEIVVGGVFTTIGGVAARNVARWNGTTWVAMDLLLPPYILLPPRDFAVLGNGTVVAGVSPSLSGPSGAPAVIAWTGSGWQPLGGASGPTGGCASLCVDATGGLLASGSMTLGGNPANLVRWNGSTWSAVGGGLDAAARVMVPDPSGQVILGGEFTTAGGQPNPRLALWDGTHWGRLGEGFFGIVTRLESTADGRLFATSTNNAMQSGRGVGGLSTLRGSVWKDSALQFGSPISDMCSTGNSLYAVTDGSSQMMHWSGGAWFSESLPTPWSPNGGIEFWTLQRTRVGLDSSGSSILLGRRVQGLISGQQSLQWHTRTHPQGAWGLVSHASTTSLEPLLVEAGVRVLRDSAILGCRIDTGDGVVHTCQQGEVFAVADWNGSTVIAGDFTYVNGAPVSRIVRKVAGTSTWLPLGSGMNGRVRALAVLHDGRLVAGGEFTQAGGAAIFYIAVFDGTTWSPLPGGGTNREVYALEVMADGTLVVGGLFSQAGGQPAEKVAFFGRICPASLQPAGAGCSGSAGPLVLTTLNEPWQGTQFRTRTTGFGPAAFGYALMGFTAPGTPLNLIHPAGGPGCLLHADPMVAHLLLPVGGVADAALAIPRSSVWLGVPFHHQVLQLEIGALGALVGLSGSNSVRLVVGVPY